jgi:signal transduction histidine kinase
MLGIGTHSDAQALISQGLVSFLGGCAQIPALENALYRIAQEALTNLREAD